MRPLPLPLGYRGCRRLPGLRRTRANLSVGLGWLRAGRRREATGANARRCRGGSTSDADAVRVEPRRSRAPARPTAPAEPASPPRKRVVIAEDEALIRLDLNETLGELGYDVVGEAGDGERAVALAEELRPDLVILDVKMPVLDGISAARRIAAARIAPVIILTAFSQRELVERARDAGAMAYLVKPFSSTELLPAIEMALSRYAEVAALEAEVADLTDRLETRKLIDRAKGVLQTTQAAQRTRCVPLDSAGCHGPARIDARRRRTTAVEPTPTIRPSALRRDRPHARDRRRAGHGRCLRARSCPSRAHSHARPDAALARRSVRPGRRSRRSR